MSSFCFRLKLKLKNHDEFICSSSFLLLPTPLLFSFLLLLSLPPPRRLPPRLFPLSRLPFSHLPFSRLPPLASSSPLVHPRLRPILPSHICLPLYLFMSSSHFPSPLSSQRLTKEGAESPSSNFDDIDDAFLEKCTEFLRLFVSVHLRRFETSRDFPMMEFLSLLFKYTFKQSSPESKLMF